ncbi:hypothetical protein D3C76_1757760 [compost metagenome]
MHHAPNVRERTVQHHMSRRVGRRAKISFDDVAFEIHNDHMLGLQLFIRHPAWLNDEQPAFPVDPAHISPRKSDQPVFG